MYPQYPQYPMQNPYQPRWQPPQQNRMELTKVNGIEGARAYQAQMPPNSTAAVFDANSDVMYIVRTDGAGYPSMIDMFTFTRMEHGTQSGDYVTRKEFEELKGMIMNAQQPVSPDAVK